MSFWDKAKNLVADFAPDLAASLVPPPAGGVARRLLAGVLGTPDDDSEAMVEALSKASPEQKIAIISEQNRHKEALAKDALENRKVDVGDIQDARDRDIDLKKAGYTNRRADAMVIVAFISFCFIVYLIQQNTDIKPGVLAIFNMAIGALLKMLGDAFSFEFGSSRGSKEKDLS